MWGCVKCGNTNPNPMDYEPCIIGDECQWDQLDGEGRIHDRYADDNWA